MKWKDTLLNQSYLDDSLISPYYSLLCRFKTPLNGFNTVAIALVYRLTVQLIPS
jgi:hypothetical protein